MFIAWCASGCALAINLLNMGSAVDFYAYFCEMPRLLGLLQDNDALTCAGSIRCVLPFTPANERPIFRKYDQDLYEMYVHA